MTEKSITRLLQTISMGCKVEKTHLKFLCPCWFIFASCGMLQKKGSKNGTLEGLESPEFALQFSWILAKFYTVLKDFHYNWSLIFNNEIDLIFTIFSVFEFQLFYSIYLFSFFFAIMNLSPKVPNYENTINFPPK